MLDHLNGGRCCSNDEMLDLFGIYIPDMLDQNACDEEFCDQYTYAMNRMRYLVARDIPVPLKVHDSEKKRLHTYYTCGRCGTTLRSDTRDEFCSKCGQRAKWPM